VPPGAIHDAKTGSNGAKVVATYVVEKASRSPHRPRNRLKCALGHGGHVPLQLLCTSPRAITVIPANYSQYLCTSVSVLVGPTRNGKNDHEYGL